MGLDPVVPLLKSCRHPWQYDKELYKKRNEAERLFWGLKGYRRVFSRLDKLEGIFTGLIAFPPHLCHAPLAPTRSSCPYKRELDLAFGCWAHSQGTGKTIIRLPCGNLFYHQSSIVIIAFIFSNSLCRSIAQLAIFSRLLGEHLWRHGIRREQDWVL